MPRSDKLMPREDKVGRHAGAKRPPTPLKEPSQAQDKELC